MCTCLVYHVFLGDYYTKCKTKIRAERPLYFRSDGSPEVKVELPVMSPAAESTAPDDHLEVYSVEKEEQESGSETEPSR